MKTLLPFLVVLAGVSMSLRASADDGPATTMAAAAQKFLGTLDPAQKAKAQLPFDSEERFNWFYIPKDRVGLPLKQMTPSQRDATMALLHAGLSEKGYTKAEAIRALEPVLAAIENNPVRRDPELYYVSIFGTPSPTEPWGWRFEGHHISQNWTVVRGRSIACSPQFFGSNPAEVRTARRPARASSPPRRISPARCCSRSTRPSARRHRQRRGAQGHAHDEHAQGDAWPTRREVRAR